MDTDNPVASYSYVDINKKCCVPNCGNSRLDNYLLHCFPNPNKEPDRFHSWVHAVGGDLVMKDKNIIFRNRKVCHKHFESRYHTWSKRLSANAVPSLYLSNSKTVELTSSHNSSDVTADPEDIPIKVQSKDSVFSWEKETHVISCEPETDDYSEELSMYADDNVQTTDFDGDGDSENYVCNECNKPIKSERFACAQCVDCDLCSLCVVEQTAHHQHYLLRVPPRRPPDEVQRVLQTIRSLLENNSTVVSLSGSANENQETDEIKIEIEDEIDSHNDPLQDVVEQLEEDNETLTCTVPLSDDIGITAKRMKPETKDDNAAPLKSWLGSRLVRRTIPTAIISAQSNVICDPSITESLTRLKAPVISNTISQTLISNTINQTPISNAISQNSISNAINQTPISNANSQTPISNAFSQTPISNTISQIPISNTISQTPFSKTISQTPTPVLVTRSAFHKPNQTLTADITSVNTQTKLKPVVINAKSKIKLQQRFRFVTGLNKLVPVASEVVADWPGQTPQPIPISVARVPSQKRRVVLKNMCIRVVKNQPPSTS